METIEKLRSEIDVIDNAILQNVKRRMEIVEKIAQVKQHSSQPIEQSDRENEIIQRLLAQKGKIKSDLIVALWKLLFEHTRKVQQR